MGGPFSWVNKAHLQNIKIDINEMVLYLYNLKCIIRQINLHSEAQRPFCVCVQDRICC